MVSSEINFCMSSPKNERLIPEIIYKCIQFLFSSSSFLFFLSCQTFFWSPFQRGLFYDSYSSWTAGCTTQLTLTLKSSWKCCLHFCFLINPKFIIWKLFWDRVNISLILACIHCLSSFHCTSLIGVWLCFSTPTQYLQPAMNLHITHHPTFSQSFHLQAEQAQLPQPPLSHHGLQALAILVGLHWTHPKELLFILSRELQNGCRTPDAVSQALTNHSSWSAGHAPAQTAQDAFVLIQTEQNSHLPFCRAAF